MTRRRRPRTEPACERCGNEEDLDYWPTGNTYCKPCTACPHEATGGQVIINGVCVVCLRRQYTLLTFEGPRIANLDYYRRRGLADYGLLAFELLFWTFDEYELAVQDEPTIRTRHPVPSARKPPPHHFF